MQTCEQCRFSNTLWLKGDEYESVSSYDYRKMKSQRVASSFECRRHAPRGPITCQKNTIEIRTFPLTSDGDWCGEFSEKVQTDAD